MSLRNVMTSDPRCYPFCWRWRLNVGSDGGPAHGRGNHPDQVLAGPVELA